MARKFSDARPVVTPQLRRERLELFVSAVLLGIAVGADRDMFISDEVAEMTIDLPRIRARLDLHELPVVTSSVRCT